MNTSRLHPALAVLAFALATMDASGAQGQFALLHPLLNPNTNAQAGANQGYSVAVDGNMAVVGAPLDDLSAYDSGVVKVYDATTGALLHVLTNPSPSPDGEDHFGRSVAIAGTRVVVGAFQDDIGSRDAGSAYVYDLASATPTTPWLRLTNPIASYGLFGNSVAISGTRVVVGAPANNIPTNGAGSAYVYDLASATPALPVLTLTYPSPAAYDGFGKAVAISGTRVLVGAFGDDAGGIVNAGSAYLYDLAGSTPAVPVFTLSKPNPAQNEWFGASVAISGTRAVVGAWGDDTGSRDAGTAHVYDLTSASPGVPILTLTNPMLAAFVYFGWSVAISGTRVIVGAYYDYPIGSEGGGAFVYDLASATPTVPMVAVGNPTPAAYDSFGFAVAIAGTRAIIGAPGDNSGAAGAGSAYSYDLAGVTPATPVATLNHPSPVLGDIFGLSVGISGTRVVVGAPHEDTGGTDSGRAYVYDLVGATPRTPVITMNNPNPGPNPRDYDHFGYSVAIAGTWAVVGAPHSDIGSDNAGSAYVYDLASALPAIPVVTLTNPSPVVEAWLGWSVAVSGTRLVVGAPHNDIRAPEGTAYIYDVAGPSPTVPVITVTNPYTTLFTGFGWSVAISGTRVVIGAIFDDIGTNSTGAAYVYDLASATPAVPITVLTNPTPAVNDQFGAAVAISGRRVVVGAWGDDTAGPDAGTAYVYDLASGTPGVPIVTLANSRPDGNNHFALQVGISDNRIVIGAHQDNSGASEAGRIDVYDLAGDTPTMPVATLTNPNPGVGDRFGGAIAIDGTTIAAGAAFDDTAAYDRGAAYIFGLVPALRIIPGAPGFATISWEPISSDFVLQHTDSFAPSNWVNTVSGAASPVTVPATNASRFYRLSQP